MARGEGIEAERRLAYVAFTRAGRRPELYHDPGRPSPFLAEAGLVDAPERRRVKRTPPPVPQPPRPPRATRAGRASSRAPTRTTSASATPAAARAPDTLSGRRRATAVLVGERGVPQNVTVGRLAHELGLTDDEMQTVLEHVDAGKRTRLRRLDDSQTRMLAAMIRRLG